MFEKLNKKFSKNWLNKFNGDLTKEPSITRLGIFLSWLLLTIVSTSHSLNHLMVSQFISISLSDLLHLIKRFVNLFTYVNISWITGHVSLSMEHSNIKYRSFWKPDFSWFFRCSAISSVLYVLFETNRLVILEHDWNTCARTSGVRSCAPKPSDSRFFIEQITSTNRELSETYKFTPNLRLFCKYPSSTSRSKILKRLSSGRRSISIDLYKFIS